MSTPSQRATQSAPNRATELSLATAFATILCLAGMLLLSSPASALEQPDIDIDNLDMVPLRTWGVSGQEPTNTQTSTLDVLVWDFAQVGDRMFVGGAFLNVQESKTSTPIPQSFVAAFDITTGVWIDTWRPKLDRAVYSLEVFGGSLIVGGEFETVNGQARAGLVALDPITGQIDQSFAGSVDRPWSDNRAMVRDMEVDGQSLYVVGNFSHINGAGGSRARSYKAGRFSSTSGALDTSWRPEVTGSSVWGIATDPARGEVHLSGFFTAVNGDANSGHFHTVSSTTGATVGGKKDLPRNFPATQPEIYDVAMGNGLIFTSGEQHIMQILQPSDHTMVGYAHTGIKEDTFEFLGIFAGGAYQVAERIGNVVFAGCHCTYSERDGFINHYSSVSNKRTPHRLVMAYEADTGRIIENFMADIHSPRDGTWAVASDTNGCLYLGGDFHAAGIDSNQNHWVGGFGKLCPKGFNPDAQPNNPNPGPDPEPDPNVVLAAGSEWRFRAGGQDLGVAWREKGYNDDAWPADKAEFGFGDKDETTLWPKGAVTYYARTSFTYDGDAPSSLELKLKADDGAIVYLNGVEVLRDNLPAGSVNYLTPAVDWRGGADENFKLHVIPADALVQGTNVLAVEVHNVWANNNDLSFDLEVGRSDLAPPAPEQEDTVALGSVWNYATSANGDPVNWTAGLPGNKAGPAQLGFGEKETTTIESGHSAYYFTHAFTVQGLGGFKGGATLDLLADDGAVVYINGIEVLRYNMPDGPINADTRPVGWINGKDESVKTFTVPGDAIVKGENVIAVRVHNYWPGNNDLSFDLGLR